MLTLTEPILLLVTVVQSRYRFQIYPFLALFGGYAIAQWKERGRQAAIRQGESALIKAARVGAVDAVQSLLGAGVDLNRITVELRVIQGLNPTSLVVGGEDTRNRILALLFGFRLGGLSP